MANLLLVEDDPALLQLETDILQRAGHSIRPAQTLNEAVSMLQQGEPNVVVMDLSLPDVKDGLELIRTIAETAKNSKIVVLSGWPGELSDAPEQILVHRIFAKPVNWNLLLQAIGELA